MNENTNVVAKIPYAETIYAEFGKTPLKRGGERELLNRDEVRAKVRTLLKLETWCKIVDESPEFVLQYPGINFQPEHVSIVVDKILEIVHLEEKEGEEIHIASRCVAKNNGVIVKIKDPHLHTYYWPSVVVRVLEGFVDVYSEGIKHELKKRMNKIGQTK